MSNSGLSELISCSVLGTLDRHTGFFWIKNHIKRSVGHFTLKKTNHVVCVNSVVAASDRSGFTSWHGSNDGVGSIAHRVKDCVLIERDHIIVDTQNRPRKVTWGCVMSETNSGNEQAQASRPRGVRRKERSGQHQPDSDRAETPQPTSSVAGRESERTGRTVSERISRFQPRGQIAGGILRQLLVKADNQLAKVENRLQQLEIERQTLEEEREQAQQEREQLQTLLENLQQTLQDTL